MKNLKTIALAATVIFAINTAIPLIVLAQAPAANVGVELSAGTLSIIYTPADFVMSPIHISSPVTTYYSYYNNPHTVDPDGNPATRDGTALRVQDGRFKGGFELQSQVDSDYTSGANTIPLANLGIRTDATGTAGPEDPTGAVISEIDETVTPGTSKTTAPLDTAGVYTNFGMPLVLLNGGTDGCDKGRVGIYTVYPSFRLLVPNNTPAGSYTTSVTYTLLEQPAC